jgi:hypothetical protein
VVGWALATDDIAAAPTTARAKGFDPGDVVDGHGVTPTGRLLHWRLTPKLAWIRRPPGAFSMIFGTARRGRFGDWD